MSAAALIVSTSDVISGAVNLVVARFTPLKIILFGSYARGEALPDSDLDFLVVMPDDADCRELMIQIHRHLRDLPLPKDILVTTPEEIAQRGDVMGSVLRSALREGRVLYERR